MLGLPNARRCQHERVSGVAHDHGEPLVTAPPDSRACSIGVDGSDAVPCIAQAEGGSRSMVPESAHDDVSTRPPGPPGVDSLPGQRGDCEDGAGNRQGRRGEPGYLQLPGCRAGHGLPRLEHEELQGPVGVVQDRCVGVACSGVAPDPQEEHGHDAGRGSEGIERALPGTCHDDLPAVRVHVHSHRPSAPRPGTGEAGTIGCLVRHPRGPGTRDIGP